MPGRPRRVLIVEDNHDLRRFFARYVARFGGESVAVASGPEALRSFQAGAFDALITDVELGDGMDGIEVARRLLALQPTLNVVMMSGDPVHAARAKETRLGAFFDKPFDSLDFLALNSALGLKGWDGAA